MRIYCPRCGATASEGARFCEQCGQRLFVERSPFLPFLDVQEETHNPYVRRERDRYGYLIPAEYPRYFNRYGFCWPGFWFPALWCCYKGIYNQAWKYILVSLIPYVGGFIASIWCGIVGYREYSDFINHSTPEEIERAKSTGCGCMVALLVVPLIVYGVLIGLVALGEGY